MVVDEAEVEEVGETSEEVTSGVDLPATTMIVAHHRATTMIVDLPLGTTMTAAHPRDTTMIATAAVAAAEEEVDITKRGPTTEGAEWTGMLEEGPKGTTALGTRTGMIGMAALAMEQDGLAPPARSTGTPGHGGITEAEAGAMRGRQDLLCHQDQLWLQDTKTGTLPRMHSLEIE